MSGEKKSHPKNPFPQTFTWMQQLSCFSFLNACSNCLWQMSLHYFMWVGVYLYGFGLAIGLVVSSSWLQTFLKQSFNGFKISSRKKASDLAGHFEPKQYWSIHHTLLCLILRMHGWKKHTHISASTARCPSLNLWGDGWCLLTHKTHKHKRSANEASGG